MQAMRFQDFEKSRLHQLAVLKALETIGEAAAKVSIHQQIEHPEIPWREIIGLRHKLVHDYFEVDLKKIWETLQVDLPQLIRMLKAIVPSSEPG